MNWGTSDTISVVSALAALASAVYAFKTYRATEQLKKYDFSLQLLTANETLRATLAELPALLAAATRSRRARLSATGAFRSGASAKWDARAAEIEAEINALAARVPKEEQGYQQQPFEELTSLIAATHAFQRRAVAVKLELEEALAEDKRQIDHLREDRRAARGPG